MTEDCARFEELQSAWLDGQLTAADHARVGAHLDECARCLTHLEGLARTRCLLRSMPVRQTPIGLFRTLEARLAAERHRPWCWGPHPGAGRGPWRGPWRVAAASAVAAGLVGAAAFGLGGQPEPTPQLVEVPVDVYAVDHLARTVGGSLTTPVLFVDS
jgi:anti-sigma factor RsiW